MIYTRRQNDEWPCPEPATEIRVDSHRPFSLNYAKSLLDRSRSKSLLLLTEGGIPWWDVHLRDTVGRLLDFLSFRGAEITHIVGPYKVPHSAYLSARLEKLYDEATLEKWART